MSKIDPLILAAVTPEWTKTAVLISKVFDSPSFDKTGLSAQDVAERLYVLIDNGQLDVKGNMRRWRDSEVKVK
ncbi:MAG TPA: DUF3658 domain-containing protein [Alphaproteobacteria bacterium]|mgnify:CR=1 FL=1|nr:DUF3658 domain-containing protein [Alphaproteobacteria bacterium]